MPSAGRPPQTRAYGYGGLCQILSDMKELQKEINALSGKLDRTFAVTDELVFKVWGGLGQVEGQGGAGLLPAHLLGLAWARALCEPCGDSAAQAWLCSVEDEVSGRGWPCEVWRWYVWGGGASPLIPFEAPPLCSGCQEG